MDPRPLLYICARPQQLAADGEHRSFSAAMDAVSPPLERHDLVREPLPEDVFERYAGFVVGGSPFNVADPNPGAVQRRVEADLERIAEAAAASETAAMFTCYGIGVLTRMFGGTVSGAFPEETSAPAITLTQEGRTDPVFGVVPEVFHAFTAHKEGTGTLPSDAVLLATNDACPVQAYRIGDRLYATQFHPEPSPRDFADRMVIYRDAGYSDPTQFDAVTELVLTAPVTEPRLMLAAFARRYAPA